jgi:TonB family protein
MAYPSHPASAPAGPERSPGADHRQEHSRLSPTLDPAQVLADLRSMISHGNWNLDGVLQHIAEAAQTVTCANGAAIAIRREHAVICQARAGDMAPELGAELDTQSGISGQCLRTGWSLRCDDTNNDSRVNGEVCRSLGMRSLAVVPVGRRPAVSGVLEAFSALPYAFRNNQLELLEELAELVLAAHRREAESPAPAINKEFSSDTVSGLTWVQTTRSLHRQASEAALKPAKALLARLPKTWSAGKAWLAPKSWLAQPRWLKHSLLLAGVAVLVFMGWLVFRGKPSRPDQVAAGQDAARRAVPPTNAAAPVASQPEISSAVHGPKVKSSPSSKVVMASKTEKAKPTEDQVLGRATQPASNANSAAPPPLSVTRSQDTETTAERAPDLASTSAGGENALSGVLSAPANLPEPVLAVSKGLTEGALVRKVEPTYPAMARAMRLEGVVKLQATVAEDGTVHDVKIVSGPPILAHAAQEAVTHWRYRPYLLNGKPVGMRTEIKVDFKLP